MQITRKSIMSGQTHTMELPVTPDMLIQWDQGVLIQDAMPHLSPDEREFLMTGITPDEWNQMMSEEEE